ncbi:hypothetical protein HMPREF3230_00710 [Gardnerella vaginalis]|uniref:Uncharacterized protein n=1 Tax=Gardnerella vaginalis TaxID=2702 RepID=A0A135Z6A3_GARVA|nr:hypothetical protein HMPREF3230_00710 [Gardnerella vaginalis]
MRKIVQQAIKPILNLLRYFLSLKSAPNIHSVHSKKCKYTTCSLNPRLERLLDVT